MKNGNKKTLKYLKKEKAEIKDANINRKNDGIEWELKRK